MLTTTALQAFRRNPPTDTKKVPDRDGLYIRITSRGTITFCWDFWVGCREGRQGTLRIGRFPIVSLADAREKLLEAKKDVAASIDPTS